MDLITKDSETTQVLFSSLDRVLENVEHIVTNYRPVLNGSWRTWSILSPTTARC